MSRERADASLVLRMCDAMAHRGPDDAGVWEAADPRVVLGNRRLAIQDLTPAGHMPMTDRTGSICITFNGELYNFRALRRDLEDLGYVFDGGSDTEVVLVAYLAWGVQCLSRFNGMFALAIYDEGRRPRDGVRRAPAPVSPQLFLARDRIGEKPLYYRHSNGELAFASELKALLADPAIARRLDLDALNAFLAFGYVPGAMCLVEGVRKLRSAHALRYDVGGGTLNVWRYWSPPASASGTRTSDAEALTDELQELLEDSVRLRLVADVPVGVLLSGGVDSSLVTACAARTARRVRTFTVSFPGEGAFDEGPFARRVSEYFGTEHHELRAEEAVTELLPELARTFDEPLADSSLVPTYLISRLTRQHVTVALGGDGGDELFAGYLHYARHLRREPWLHSVPRPVRSWVRSAGGRLPVGLKGRHFLVSIGDDLAGSAVLSGTVFDEAARRWLFGSHVLQRVQDVAAPEKDRRSIWRASGGPLERMTLLDLETYLADDILVKVDRASMAVSLEMRTPWLDHRIVEFAFGRVPDELKRSPTAGAKVLPRVLARRLLPSDLDLTRKQGFSVPLSQWFRSGWLVQAREVLADVDPRLFRTEAVQRLLRHQRNGFANGTRLFALMMFELWRREYQVML